MTAIAEHPTEHPDDHAEGHDHPTEQTYWVVGLVLAVLTGLEVSTYWWPHAWHKVTAVLLIILMVIKFTTVGAYFMHLKFDSKVLRRVFMFGIFLALSLYIATLSAFTFWDQSGTTNFVYPPRSKPIPPPPTEAPPSIPAAVTH